MPSSVGMNFFCVASDRDLCVTIFLSFLIVLYLDGKLSLCIFLKKKTYTRLKVSVRVGKKNSRLFSACIKTERLYRNVNGFKMTIVLVTLFDGAVMACNFFSYSFHRRTSSQIFFSRNENIPGIKK